MKNKPFAKVFGNDEHQVAIILEPDDENKPRLRILFQPNNLGVCSFGFSYDDNNAGWDTAEEQFDKMDEARARSLVAKAVKGILEDDETANLAKTKNTP